MSQPRPSGLARTAALGYTSPRDMELRELAERVLFSTSLEQKLQPVDVWTDTQPGPALRVPALPSRPPELRFKPQGAGKSDFPGAHRLEQESERGRLLHFFANHELLAAELMALVLLRFPEAPAAFRRGVGRTLQDEQAHTRLYLERMRACGVQFGDRPVSGYFWRALCHMDSPLDYVTGLSLTFEQANLDFCQHYARCFRAVGDSQTAALLERIYRDEISHVAYGLKWFRRWKDPEASDWEAFRRQLRYPLSPSRAKGVGLDVSGRRAAGLAPAFIDELNVHAQSKGRTPCVFVFNPFVEPRLAAGRSFTPTKHQAQLAADLGNLPQFLARQDDIVWVARRPSVRFLSGLKQAGFALPEFVEMKQAPIAARRSRDPAAVPRGFAHRRLGSLRPWAWGPDSLELFEPLFAQVSGGKPDLARRFEADIAPLYSKAWSAALLREVLAREADRTWLCSEHAVGVAVHTVEEALRVVTDIRARGHHRVVVKAAFGLAGQGMIRLWEPSPLETQRRWMSRALARGQPLVIEPWLERELDFSIQLEMSAGGLALCGYTRLINDGRGQFQASRAGVNHRRRLPAEVATAFPEPGRVQIGFQRLYERILSRLQQALKERGFRGPIGIDALVYRTPEGAPRLKPIVEINPRYTMGRVAIELMKQTCPGSQGLFFLVTRQQAHAEGHADFVGYASALAERFPLCLEGEPVPRIRSGAFCLNDPAQAEGVLAVFRVDRGDVEVVKEFGHMRPA